MKVQTPHPRTERSADGTLHVGASPQGARRVALVGTGYIAEYHAKALRVVPGVELAAVCDRARGRAESFANEYGVDEVYGRIEDLIASGRIDAAHVLTPPDAHAKVAAQLLEAGIPVLLEKPMAISVPECEHLESLSRTHRVKLGVAHNFLFAEPYASLRQDVQGHRFGEVDSVSIAWHRPLGQLVGGPFNAWMLANPTNILFEIGPHPFGMLLDLVGIPEDVHVRPSDAVILPTGVTFYRQWSIYARRGRTVANVSLSFARGFTEHSVHVRGATGSGTADLEQNTYVPRFHVPREMDFDRYAQSVTEARELKRQARQTLLGYVASKVRPSAKGSPYGFGIAKAVECFHAQLGGEAEPRLSAALGRDVIALCERIRDQVPPAPERPQSSVTVATEVEQHRHRVLVLGATGFIGQELVRRLVERGTPPRVLVRSAAKMPASLIAAGVDVVEGNAASSPDLDRALEGVDCVVHLARAQVKTWADYQAHEIEMTRRVAERSLARGVRRFIYTGTIDSYYAGPGAGTITEETPLDPKIRSRNFYARAKAVSEGLLLEMSHSQGLPLVIFRPGIVIGRGASPAHWGVGMWKYDSICQTWGEGNNKLPLVLVEDVASGLIAGIDADDSILGESFNLIGDPLLSGNEYLDELERAAGVTLQRFHTPIATFYAVAMTKWLVKVAVRYPDRDMPTYRDWASRTQLAHFDCSKAKRVLGWKPETDRERLIREGIAAAAASW